MKKVRLDSLPNGSVYKYNGENSAELRVKIGWNSVSTFKVLRLWPLGKHGMMMEGTEDSGAMVFHVKKWKIVAK